MKPWEKVLHVDVESFPALFYAWKTWEATSLKLLENTSLCGWSVKWHQGKQTTKCLADYKGYKPHSRDDKKLCEELWEFLDEAEVVVAHNGRAFDTRLINARFTYHGMKPPSPYAVVDTLKQARSIGKYDSNKLNDLGQFFGLGKKLRTGGADLWFDCMEGDKQAWNHMKKYNAQDVILLEKIYVRLLPWMKGHPNLATPYGPHVCPKCGGTEFRSKGLKYNQTTAYRQLNCRACGASVRDTTNIIRKEDKPFVAI